MGEIRKATTPRKSFGSFSLAQDTVNVMRRVAAEQIDKLRPRYRLAVVDSIDRVNLKCDVIYVGESTPVTVSMGSIQPLDIGQTVRIAGLTGDRYIDDVLGEAYGTGGGTVEPGFRISTSATKPVTNTLDGFPLIWVPGGSTLPPTPVTPTAPAFNYSTFAVTPPSIAGVLYQLWDYSGSTWVNLTSGSATSLSGFTRPYVAKVRAVALSGYVLTASYEWDALFYDSSAFALAASESFNRTAATILAPTQGVAGLAFDMAGGGSDSPAPNWWQYHSSGNDFGIQSGGTTVGRYPAASGNSALWFTSPANFAIEVDITVWPRAHPRSWSVYIAAPASNIYGSNQPTVSFTTPSGNSFVVNFAPATGMSGTTSYTHIGSGSLTADSQLYGTYRVSWINKYLQVTMPGGATYGRDYSSMTYVPTTWSFLRVAESDASVIEFNNFRIYK